MAINNAITYGEVEDFFSTLMAPETPKMRKYHVYGMYQREQENEKKVAEFENAAGGTKGTWRYFGTMIGEDMCVLTLSKREDAEYFFPAYKDKDGKIHIALEGFADFDLAVLACVAYKHTNSTNSIPWISKLIREDDTDNG